MTSRLLSVPGSPSPTGSVSVFLRDVLHGLSRPSKRLPCKYFYDEIGGQLFDRICELEEYYPTRCELAIVAKHASAMTEWMGDGVVLIEYGSGSSRKTRLLLDRIHEPAAYLPVDINGEQLQRTSRSLARLYPRLQVHAVEADFTRLATLPVPLRPAARRVVYFSGSTIGNFEPAAARELLARIAGLCGPGGGLLIGVDLKKDPRILHAAYNDRANVTAAFNVHLLDRINRELVRGLRSGWLRSLRLLQSQSWPHRDAPDQSKSAGGVCRRFELRAGGGGEHLYGILLQVQS